MHNIMTYYNAFRYTGDFNPAYGNLAENCYLSPKDYRNLDYYYHIEPDRDFDIYTMNNLDKCEKPFAEQEVESGKCN